MTSLVVLAAGLATRYGSVKQLEAVGPGGERLFDYAVFDALRAGCDDVVIVIRPELREVFERDVVPLWSSRTRITLAEQKSPRAKPWGTAHALLAAAPHVSGDVMVCNADDWYGRSAYAIVQQQLQQQPDVHAVAGYRLESTLSEHGGVTRAVCRTDANGMLQRIEETSGIEASNNELPRGTLVSMNLWGFHPSFLEQLEHGVAKFIRGAGDDPKAELPIPVFVNDLIGHRQTQVSVLPVDEEWFGMTFAADRARVREAIEAHVERGEYPQNLFKSS